MRTASWLHCSGLPKDVQTTFDDLPFEGPKLFSGHTDSALHPEPCCSHWGCMCLQKKSGVLEPKLLKDWDYFSTISIFSLSPRSPSIESPNHKNRGHPPLLLLNQPLPVRGTFDAWIMSVRQPTSLNQLLCHLNPFWRPTISLLTCLGISYLRQVDIGGSQNELLCTLPFHSSFHPTPSHFRDSSHGELLK